MNALTARDALPVVESFAAGTPYRTMVEALPSAAQVHFNVQYPNSGAKYPWGIYIGGTGTYKLFVELGGGQADGRSAIPFLDVPGGTILHICTRKILKDDRYTTDAPNILVLF